MKAKDKQALSIATKDCKHITHYLIANLAYT